MKRITFLLIVVLGGLAFTSGRAHYDETPIFPATRRSAVVILFSRVIHIDTRRSLWQQIPST